MATLAPLNYSGGEYYKWNLLYSSMAGAMFQNTTGKTIKITGIQTYNIKYGDYSHASSTRAFISDPFISSSATSVSVPNDSAHRSNTTTLTFNSTNTFTFSTPMVVSANQYFVAGIEGGTSSSVVWFDGLRNASTVNCWYSANKANTTISKRTGYWNDTNYLSPNITIIYEDYYTETNDASIFGGIHWEDENGNELWCEDENGNLVNYPFSIYVTLLQDGIPYRRPDGSEAVDGGGNGWGFTGLPVYSNLTTGTKYVYTPSFPEVDGYTKSVSADGLNVTYRKIVQGNITVTVTGASNRYDISVYFSNASPEYIYCNGTYTYPVSGYGCVTEVQAHDWGTGEDLSVPINDPYNVTIDFGGDPSDFIFNGTIKFINDNPSVRPNTINATHWSTGSDCGVVQIPVEGAEFNYTLDPFGSGYISNGDEALEFHEIAGYTMTTSPANSDYCNRKNVTYTYIVEKSKWKEATAYVYKNGRWKIAESYNNDDNAWECATFFVYESEE